MAALSLLREVHEEVSILQKLSSFRFEDEALFLAACIVGGVRDKFFDLLKRACEFREDHKKELNKRKYVLRRALVEYKQLVKDRDKEEAAAAKYGANYCWPSHVEKELKDGFVDLVRFMKTRMHVMHDAFVSSVHDAERVEDYAQVLNQLDAEKVDDLFKKENIVGTNEIAKAASQLTGMPASWYITKPQERFLRFQEQFRKKSEFSQYVSRIELITEVFLKPKNWSSWSQRPLGTFLFAGPRGIHKSDIAKAIACEIYDDESRFTRIDMEKYMEPNSVSCFIATFTEIVKNKPYSVVVFDKIEKAPPPVLDSLISILPSTNEEPKKRKRNDIDLRNTVVIMTSDLDLDEFHEIMLRSGSRQENAARFFEYKLLELVDDVILIYWPICRVNDMLRVMLREWACSKTKEGNGAIILCPSNSALGLILKASKFQATPSDILKAKSWLEEEVFAVLSKKLDDDTVAAENVTIYIDRDPASERLTFKLMYNESV